jgi:glycosyltransferase involved in cell wall biosynthesis
MKIAFCSALPFGVLGSPGTYKFIEACMDHVNLVVIAPKGGEKTVFSNPAIPIIPVANPGSSVSIKRIIRYLQRFDPDIIYLFNFTYWPNLLSSLKKRFINKKFVLDIKSPLLAEGDLRQQIQDTGESAQPFLDAIVTLAQENVPTWIPNCTIPVSVYPLGIDCRDFRPVKARCRETCRRYVYIGVLHEKRRLDQLISAFHTFLTTYGRTAVLDIYGTGPDHDRLAAMIDTLPTRDAITLCGLRSQKELIHLLHTYDAGIAWVPYEEYNTSPSLKAIEYMAAGLPILASDTRAHKRLEDFGCTLSYFKNTPDSIGEALDRLTASGFSLKRVAQNLSAVEQFDYHAIIDAFFFPLFETLLTKNHEGIQRILFVGPIGFRPGVWETRASYILPDLFRAVPATFKIHLLTAPVPDFARGRFDRLCKEFDIAHMEAHPKPDAISYYEYWRIEVMSAALQIRPDVITNIFGPVTLGVPMGLSGRQVGARVILRVAGDEIASRLSIGTYYKTAAALDSDLSWQACGVQMADTVIVMSPLEKKRIMNVLDRRDYNKVKICIRGVDVKRFQKTRKNYLAQPVKSFLYIGRKSLEKGYDLLEKVANGIYNENQQIRFRFVGSFDRMTSRNMDYIGWVDSRDLPRVYDESDAFIMTSRSEGFPQAVAECMAAGLPSILARHIFESLVEDGKQALLTELDTQEIIRAVHRLHHDKELAASLSKNARDFAKQFLDKERWSAIYQNILEGRHMDADNPLDDMNPFENENEGIRFPDAEGHMLTIVVTASGEVLSRSMLWHLLNRFLTEMIKRGHRVYLVYPDSAALFSEPDANLVCLPWQSGGEIRQLIRDIDPDIVLAATTSREQQLYYPLLYELSLPVVWIWLSPLSKQQREDTLEAATALFEQEIMLSLAARILTWHIPEISLFAPYVRNRIVCCPTPVFPTENDRPVERFLLPLEEISLNAWEGANRSVYDLVESSLREAADVKKDPEKVFNAQADCYHLRAGHARRMRDKVYEKYKDKGI